MEALTYSTVAVTLGLVVARPRIGPRFRLSPAVAALMGVAFLAAIGSVSLADVGGAARTMWRPLVGIVSIMLMTGVARRTGVLAGVADLVFARAEGSPTKLFASVFVFGVLTAAILNNDSAILLLTPLVVDAAKKRHRTLVVPLAFAVFLSAGVAPFVVSNPMNMVVASVAGIGFNEYAQHMVLPAIAAAATGVVGGGTHVADDGDDEPVAPDVDAGTSDVGAAVGTDDEAVGAAVDAVVVTDEEVDVVVGTMVTPVADVEVVTAAVVEEPLQAASVARVTSATANDMRLRVPR